MGWWLADVGLLAGVALAARVLGPVLRRHTHAARREGWVVGFVPPSRFNAVEHPPGPELAGARLADEAAAWLERQ